MLITCFYLVLTINPEAESIDLVDLHVGTLASSARLSGHIGLVGMTVTKGPVGFKIERFLFDFKTRRTVLLSDPRIPRGAFRVIAGRYDFYFFDTIKSNISILHRDGTFKDSRRINRFFTDEALNEMDLTFAAPYTPGKALLTMRKENMLFLIDVDMDNREIHFLHAQETKTDFRRCYWVWDGAHIYFVNGDTSRIDVHDIANGHEIRTIRKAIEPVAYNSNLQAFKGAYRYKSMIGNLIVNDGTIFMYLNKRRNWLGEVLNPSQKRMIQVRDVKVKESKREPFSIGSYEGERLFYDPVAGDFSLK